MFNFKKAGVKYLSIWWFFCLLIIGAGIVIAVGIFVNADIDIKKIESQILITKVVDGIVEEYVYDYTNKRSNFLG